MRYLQNLFEMFFRKNSVLKKHRDVVVFLFFLALFAWLYLPRLHGHLILDDHTLVEVSRLHHLSNIPSFFQKPLFSNNRFRPMGQTVRAILFVVFRDNILFYRMLNFILFVIYGVLIFLFVRKILDNKDLAMLASLLFCFHPFHVYFIYYYTSLDALIANISVISGLLCLLNFIERKKIHFYIFSNLLFVLSILFYEINLIFPVYAALFIWFYSRRINRPKENMILASSYFIIAVSYVLIRIFSHTLSMDPIFSKISLGLNYFLAFFQLISWYLTKLIYPSSSVFLYNIPYETEYSLLKIFSVLVILFILFGVLFSKKGKGVASLSLIWFMVGFVPAGAAMFCLPEQGFVIQMQWFSFSVIGFFLLVSHGLFVLRKQVSHRLWLVLVCAIGMFFLNETNEKIHAWKDEMTYSRYFRKAAPKNTAIYDYLFKGAMRAGDYQQAKKYALETIRLDSSQPAPYNNLGLLRLERGDVDGAIEKFNKAISLNSRYAVAYNNLGIALFKKKKPEQAAQAFSKATEINAYLLEPRLNLAVIYREKGMLQAARRLYEENLKIDPYNEKSLYPLLVVSQDLKDYKSVRHLGEVILKTSSDTHLLVKAGSFLAQKGQVQLALSCFFRALKVDPSNENAYLELGKLYGNLEKFDEAIKIWEAGENIATQKMRFVELIRKAQNLLNKD